MTVISSSGQGNSAMKEANQTDSENSDRSRNNSEIESLTPSRAAQFLLKMSSLKRRTSVEKRKASSENDDPYGWFEDFEATPKHLAHDENTTYFHQQPLQRSLSLPGPLTTPPFYVLESSLETQQLWYITAGQRPKQPDKERKYFEKLWEQNFENSSVKENNTNTHTNGTLRVINSIEKLPKSDFNGEILLRGAGSFTNSVSKSFVDIAMTSITIQIPRFRVVKTINSSGGSNGVHAEFLNVVSLGSGRSSIVFGIWRRHSDFHRLATKIEYENMCHTGIFKNTLLSWHCVLQRKRWFRCLDKDYLALKCFLLERFIHDLLFESQTPRIISDFLGLD